MTDKEELRIALHNKFHNICQIRVIEGGHKDVEIEKEVADFIYSYFQSKQQEKIERVRKLPSIYIESHPSGIKDGQFLSISDVLKIMEEK